MLRRIVMVLAALLILGGVAGIARMGYQLWDPFGASRQTTAQNALYHKWGSGKTAPVPGTGHPGLARKAASRGCHMAGHPTAGQVFAIIQIPAFGPRWKFTIIQGTTLAQLSTGPGHILHTALPGQRGNVGIAAHDVTAGNPFLHLASLRPGDRVIITTRGCVTTYRVSRPSFRVWYTDTGVLRPHGHKHTITLVTCWPTGVLYFVNHRTIVTGTEVRSVPR